MDPGAHFRLELTLPPIEITIASRKAYAPAEVVPEGRNESSPGAEHFDRPWRDGRLLLPHFSALRAGLLSLSPFGTTSAHPRLREPITPMTNEQPRNTYVSSCFLYRATSLGYLSY
jgi:hypothetical protein